MVFIFSNNYEARSSIENGKLWGIRGLKRKDMSVCRVEKQADQVSQVGFVHRVECL